MFHKAKENKFSPVCLLWIMIYVNNYVPTKYEIRLVLEMFVFLLIFPETLYDHFLDQVDDTKNITSRQIIMYLVINIDFFQTYFLNYLKPYQGIWE